MNTGTIFSKKSKVFGFDKSALDEESGEIDLEKGNRPSSVRKSKNFQENHVSKMSSSTKLLNKAICFSDFDSYKESESKPLLGQRVSFKDRGDGEIIFDDDDEEVKSSLPRKYRNTIEKKKSIAAELFLKLNSLKLEFPLILQQFPPDTVLNPLNFKEKLAKECESVFGSMPEKGLAEETRNKKLEKHLLQFRVISKLEGAILKNYFKTWRDKVKMVTNKTKLDKELAQNELADRLREKLMKRKEEKLKTEALSIYKSDVKLEKKQEKNAEEAAVDKTSKKPGAEIKSRQVDASIVSKLPGENLRKFIPFCNDVIINKKYLI